MSEEKTKCIACKEFIWADATICPQCQTHQKKQLGKSLLTALKELSAVTVVFTLIFAVMELNRFADAWFENSTYVSRLVSSASMLIEAGEYSGARRLLADAKKISPTSDEVNILQMQLAMIRIRKRGGSAQDINISRNVLYHNLGRSPKSDATVLAHIAWASYSDNGRDKKIDINLYLEKALALDETSLYANIYKGMWYLRVYPYLKLSNPLNNAQITAKAQHHFNMALQQNINSQYVRRIQLSSLIYSADNRTGFEEYQKIVFAMYANNDAYFLNERKRIISKLLKPYTFAILDAVNNKDVYLNNTYLKKSERLINTLKKISVKESPYIKTVPFVLLAIASDHKGDYLSAIENFIIAYKIVMKTSSNMSRDIPVFIKRICDNPEKLEPTSIARCDYFFTDVFKAR